MRMSTQEDNKKKAKFYDPDTKLKQKVGGDTLKKETVEKADTFIEKNDVDFEPMARDFLNDMRKSLDRAHRGELNQKQLVEEMTLPVMQLKGNAATFKYPLITALMNTLLNFLETLDSLNKDVLKISEVYYSTVRVVLAHKMKGDIDKRGELLIKELERTIQRYRKKYNH